MTEIVGTGQAGYWVSFVVAYGIGGLFTGTILWLAAAQVVRNLSRAKLARKIEILEKKPLEEGPAVLRGTVEPDDEDAGGTPVKSIVHQVGTEVHGKNGWSHTWKETRREIVARPFYLALPSGERIRVVADQRTMLADELDSVDRDSEERFTRRRCAELEVGETVIASGVLKREKAPVGEGGGYRGGGTVMVLRPPPRQKLLLSTAPLERRFLQCAGHYALWATFIAAFLGIFHATGFADFHRLNAEGVVVRGTSVSTETYETVHKGKYTTHYRVTALGPDGEPLMSDVSRELYVEAQSLVSVPFVMVPSKPSIHQIGNVPRLGWFSIIMFGFILIGGLLFYRFVPFASARLPWYERRKIVDSAPGRL